MRQGLAIAAFASVSALALAGWVRKPVPQAVNYPAQLSSFRNPAYDDGASAEPCVSPANYSSLPAYSSERYVRTARRPSPAPAVEQQPQRRYYSSAPAARRGRSLKKSAAIVGGSAGVGAAIGALAGGGKGAAIGALSGGAAGFVYDRLTHRR